MDKLATLLVVLLCLNAATLSHNEHINILDYGAVGDGYVDDSQAFFRAWKVACHSAFAHSVTMTIPNKRTFLVNPMVFKGPCKPMHINFQILGTIISPESIKTWKGMDPTQWLAFQSITGLSLDGFGTIDGRGTNWWAKSCRYNDGKGCTTKAPTAIKFLSCHNSFVRNLHFVNSANSHILLKECSWFNIHNVVISSPKSSPNTDGIHIQRSNNILIDQANISSGDDCISIGDETSYITINNINCGPGHGISVGSLGKGGSNVKVENIHVSHVNFHDTTNGVRIKTWPGATGYARDITFEYLNFTSVQNPIIIDQYYCNKLYLGYCKSVEKSDDGVHISGVTYRRAVGTSSTKVAIKLECSHFVACSGILLDSIQLTPKQHHSHHHHHPQVVSSCTNARGRTIGLIKPNIPCLIQE